MYNYHNTATVFVSQKCGDDTFGNGLSPKKDRYGAPFATIERAIDLVAELRVSGNDRPMTIALCDDYYITAPIKVGAKFLCSRFGQTFGVDGITITSHGSRKKLVGGIKLSNWKEDIFNGKSCISCQLEKDAQGNYPIFTDLLVNGKRAFLTRYPKDKELTGVSTENPNECQWDHFRSSKWFKAHKKDLDGIVGIEDAIVTYYHYWVDEHTPVESYDKETGVLTFAYPSRFSLSTDYENPKTSDLHYFLENLPQFFENENEWYLDRKAGKVYYIPKKDTDVKNIECFAPLAERLFDIEGTAEKRVCDINICNLSLVCTKGDYISRMTNDGQGWYNSESAAFASDIQSVCMAYGALNFTFADRCSVSDCELLGLGVHSININEGCRNIRIENNSISECAAGGVRIFGAPFGSEEALDTSHNVVRGNVIKNIGLRYEAACGILICHSHNNEISENEICYTGYTGISCGWVWGYDPSTTYGNIIRKNHIHHIGRERMSDLGGIYTLGEQKGTVIDGNIIHDVISRHYCGNGIYLDEGSGYITVTNNLVYDAKTASFLLHYGKQNVIKNNIFAFSRLGIDIGRKEFHESLIFERNIFVTDGNPVIGFKYFDHFPLYGRDNIIYDVSGKKAKIFGGNTLPECDKKLTESMEKTFGAIFKNPGFVNAKKRNFKFLANSFAVNELGFKNI